MDTESIALILLAATGLIVLLFSSRGSRRVSSVSPAPCERRRDASDELRPLAPFSLLGSFDLADPGATLIWSTQVPALQFVRDHEPRGTPCTSLKPIYAELARRCPEIYDGYNFHHWGQLMVDLDLFRVEAEWVHITQAGRALLKTLATSFPHRAPNGQSYATANNR